ncbi:MAG: hypothetical protein GOV01_03620 [Candidatus Altiarchaeota archaeon]|nr:hypothetical protein [Candidatus Altiarchaeota archaeon]
MEILLNNALDFFETAEEKNSESKFTVAVVNYFKALISLIDYGLFSKKGIFPKNHEERFKMLQHIFPGLLGIVRDSYGSYRRAYSERLDHEDAGFLREEVLKVAKEIGVLEKFSK